MGVLVGIAEAIEEIRAGRMVILVDDEDRENEGDLTMAADNGHAGSREFHDQVWSRPRCVSP